MERPVNKMESMPVRPLLLQMSWPIMLSMMIQALYNLVDSMFVAKLSSDGFVALSLAFPVQSIIVALCAGSAVGLNALISRRLGEHRPDLASRIAVNGYFVFGVISVLFLVFGLTGSRAFISLFSDVPAVIGYGEQYISIVTVFAFTVAGQICSERVLQASGNTIGPMIGQSSGALLNILLDPLLIFGVGPFPRLEVAGAAIATVISQFFGMVLTLWMVRRSPVLKLTFRGFRPDLHVIRAIYEIGLPAILIQLLSSVMMLGMNKVMAYFTVNGVFLLGAYYKLQSFCFMPVFGLNNGMIPIIGYNYGARNPQRIHATVRFALVMALSVMSLGTLLFAAAPTLLLRLFSADAAQMADGVIALRMLSPVFLFASVSVILCAAFQAVGAPRSSLLVSVLRQLGFLLPLAILLGFLRPGAIWLAFPLSEGVACVLSLLLYRHISRTRVDPLSQAD